MSNVTRNKTLIVVIVVLLVTNIALLILLLRTRDQHQPPQRPGFTERLKKEVGFTPEQMQVFEPRKKAFWATMRNRFDSIKKAKEEFYFHIYNTETPDSVLLVKAEQIAAQQKELDLFVFRHFSDVRKLCSPEQLPKYDSLMPAIIRRMTERPGKK